MGQSNSIVQIYKETMHESTLVEYLTEKATAEAHQQGVQQGEKKRAIDDIIKVLDKIAY